MRGGAYVAGLILFFSCTAKTSIPKDVLHPKEMRSIVWDILQADELASQNKQNDTTINLKSESFRLYDQVFALHKISRQQYYKSYQFYQEHPDLYKSLMEDVKKFSQQKKTATADSLR
jgi:hypothetical protein